MSEMIHATFRPHFSLGPAKAVRVRPGATLEELARQMDLPAEWWLPGRGVITLDGELVPRAMWARVRPKAAATEVQFLFALQGGGGRNGRKNPLALIASLALLAVTGFVAGGGLATRFGLNSALFGARTIGANLTAGVIGLAGNALLAGLVRPGGVGGGEIGAEATDAPNTAGIEGNALTRRGAIPRVMGSRGDVYPPLAAEPLTWFDGEDEVTEAVYVLAGPHAMSNLRLGGVPVADLRGVEVETLEGWPGQPRLDLIRRYARTEQVGQELRGHVLREDGETVDDQAEQGWQPQGYVIATREAPDELWIGLTWPQGLNINASGEDRLRVPVRLRVRPVGATSWINLPELHYVGVALRPIRATIKLRWAAAPAVQVAAAGQEGWIEARLTTPAQTAAPAGGAWAADASFDDGAGDAWLIASNYETTRVRRVQMSRDEAVIWLDTATFAPGFWEVEISRGVAVKNADYATTTYQVGGAVWNLFGAQGVGALKVAQAQKDRVSTVGIVRASSVWNDHPAPTDKCAVIGIRVRNREVGRLSLTAAGYVRGPDGAWITTSNPAPHYRDALTGRFNPRPVPAALVDDDDLDTWHDGCAARGYQINAIVEGGTVREVLTRIAAAGYALPRMSNEWGVIRGRDTTVEDPVMLFSPRNARSISVSKSFPVLPDGLRVTFRDAERNYIEREIIYPERARGGLLLAVTYPDRITEAEVLQQAAFDLRELRQTATYSWETGAAALGFRRGDLVELQADVLDMHAGAGRVVDWAENGAGEVTEIRLDSLVPVVNEPDFLAITDFLAVPDFLAIGTVTSLALRGADGGPVRSVVPVANASGETDTLELAEPLADSGIYPGALVAVGPTGRVTRRLIVSDIRRRGVFDAAVSAVAELPELFADH